MHLLAFAGCRVRAVGCVPHLFAYIETYDNRQRLRSALGYRTPEQIKTQVT